MYLPQCNNMYGSVTPATYNVYAPDTTGYAAYYQYSANMQSSPQDNGGYGMVLHPSQNQGGGAQSPHSIEDSDGNLGQSTRASPATIQWLLDNYETADGTSLPRCTLYDHYKKHCTEHRLDPVNAASFGKLIRSVFLGLRTRRLGTRGNSKYHYYGIRIKPESPLNRHNQHSQYTCPPDSYADTVNTVAAVRYNSPPESRPTQQQHQQQHQQQNQQQQPLIGEPAAKRMKTTHSSSSSSCRDSTSPAIDMNQPLPPLLIQNPNQNISINLNHMPNSNQNQIQHQIAPTSLIASPIIAPISDTTLQIQQIGAQAQNAQQLAAQPQSAIQIPQEMYTPYMTIHDRVSLGTNEMPYIPFSNSISLESTMSFRKLGLDFDHIEKFINSYHNLCKEVLHQVKILEFESIEDCWVKFWHGSDYLITKEELIALCTLEPIQDYMIQLDLALYQNIVDCLIPNVLMSQLTANLTQACRNFAKNIDIYLKKAIQNCGISEDLVKKKMQAIKYMQQGLRRYTSLNHLAQAARAVLQKQEQVTQMFTDYMRVDMNQVHEQAGWICGCDTLMVQHVNLAFKANLQRIAPMVDWAEWLESIVDQVLAKYHDKPADAIANVGKQFLLNWSFYTSMIIRDLTLRSATSFGSFHLIRLLADDYMYYLIESKIAKAGKQHLITVIRQDKDYPLFNEQHEYIIPSANDLNNINDIENIYDESEILQM
ncbi:unnamed protein product [Caenorhabditis angaria]|uniref:RFX-type winged-helix domain-containing protein n=1 Tax=Caenorhabditis angaria TaxID=860376 RepID=A0A9P1ID28_9PELO|nr:unnamed protein product [Caenorhabditis angaria]